MRQNEPCEATKQLMTPIEFTAQLYYRPRTLSLRLRSTLDALLKICITASVQPYRRRPERESWLLLAGFELPGALTSNSLIPLLFASCKLAGASLYMASWEGLAHRCAARAV